MKKKDIKTFLEFTELPLKGKTKRIAIFSKVNSELLGHIQWYGAFRKYCFFPSNSTIWDKNCLNEINNKLELLMVEWKESKKND